MLGLIYKEKKQLKRTIHLVSTLNFPKKILTP